MSNYDVDTLTEQISALDISLDLEADVYACFASNYSYEPSEIEDWKEEAEESYQGYYSSDEDFAQNLAEEIGAVNENATWPNDCIDWEHAARELMYDYFEVNGNYFRNI